MRLKFNKIDIVPGGTDLKPAPIGSTLKSLMEQNIDVKKLQGITQETTNVGKTLVASKWKPLEVSK